ncbi:dirigent protein 15-like [Hordeum vulgare]|nr:dirigent protein 15-like [Hordeum vulgare]
MRRTLSLLAVLLLLLLAFHPRNAADAHAHRFRLGKEKVTNLHFYLHDTLSGRDPTAVPVARGAGATPRPGDPTPFSSVYVVDDVLTEGPERTSRVVGSAQGLYASTGRHALGLVLGIDFALNDYNGSSFVVFSRNPVADGDGRELAVVGGRGAFRMARGFALLRTHYLNTGNGDAIIEYNVTLLHQR